MTGFRWLILAAVIAEGVAVAIIARRNGAPEAVAWWVFLIIPLLLGAMLVFEIVRTLLRRGGR